MPERPQFFVDFLDPAIPLLQAFDEWRKDAGITTATARADHLGYQCGDPTEYEYLCRIAEPDAVFIFQSVISGRRISLVRLKPGEGLHTSLGTIEVIEIADQKLGTRKPRGYNHIEIYPVANCGEGDAAERERNMESLRRQLNGEFRDPRFGPLPHFAPSGRKHHPTYDALIRKGEDGLADFSVRIEPEPLLLKIARDEFR